MARRIASSNPLMKLARIPAKTPACCAEATGASQYVRAQTSFLWVVQALAAADPVYSKKRGDIGEAVVTLHARCGRDHNLNVRPGVDRAGIAGSQRRRRRTA
jgi:hypothetical protein